MKEPQFDFKALAKQTFNDWKRFFRDNFVFTKVINTKEISEPIVEAIKNKEIPVVSAEEISTPIVNALYKVQESVEMKEGIEEVTVKNIGDAKADMTEVVSVLENIRDKEYPAFPEIPAQKESIKIDGEVVISKPSWFKPVDLSETNKTLKEIAKKEYPEFPKFPEFPSFADIFQKALSPIKDVLEKILAKPEKENPPFEFDEFGRVKVNVDRAGGGGGNPSVMLETKNGEILNPATEETLSLATAPAQTLYDKTSGSLDYKGKNSSATAVEGDSTWQITKYVRVSGSLTQKITKTGSWTGRVALF